MAASRRRGAPLRRWRVRHRDVLPRNHVRPAPPGRADELVRVCRPGGTIGLLSWTPEGFIGQMFAAMKPYAPPPPPGAQPPPLWGREHHVRSLLADRVTGITAQRGTVRVDSSPARQPTSATTSRPATGRPSPPTRASPTIASATRRHSTRTLAELARRHDHGTGTTVMDWEYLLLTGRKHYSQHGSR